MRCTHPISIRGAEFPCGQCMACRLNYARMWSIRISQEASLYKHNTFLTLTYDNEHLPEHGTLVKRDVQLFLKRFRKALGVKKIRYYLCGEYGDQFGRPHYHICLFNIAKDSDIFLDKVSDGRGNYRCRLATWPYGLVHTGDVTVDSANYVAGYITKKLKGKDAKRYYENKNIIPEFVLMSRRPGIGVDFLLKNFDKIMNNGFVWCKGKKYAIPRHYLSKLPEEYVELKKEEYAEKKNKEWNEAYDSGKLYARSWIYRKDQREIQDKEIKALQMIYMKERKN